MAAALVLIAAGFAIGFRMAQPPPPPDFEALRQAAEGDGDAAAAPAVPTSSAPPSPGASDRGVDPPRTEPPPSAPGMEPLVVARQPAPGRSGAPRIALVIDDLGRSLADIEALGRLGVPITYAVLPFETRTPEVVSMLRGRGQEIFVHLPMEAKGAANPGPGALRVAMADAELRRLTAAALDAVPGAVGVNNHMGSAVAADRRSMSTVLQELKQRGLVFLDSRTSADSLGYSLARQFDVPAGERQVFLDTHRDRDFIRKQFRVLRKSSTKRGAAIAIAHPYRETLEILAEEVPAAKADGFEFLVASRLFDR
ncbi:MAG: divergent polysaccharide deacetylase family protein [Acidobacteriota bacterium]